jgi:hypothetical protein
MASTPYSVAYKLSEFFACKLIQENSSFFLNSYVHKNVIHTT